MPRLVAIAQPIAVVAAIGEVAARAWIACRFDGTSEVQIRGEGEDAPNANLDLGGLLVWLVKHEQELLLRSGLVRRVLLDEVLASASPNERDHPTMWRAWRNAEAQLAALTLPSSEGK